MAKINTGFSAYSKFCVYLLSPSNHFGLTFEQEKNKGKQNFLIKY